jgi:tetratricopeptide (TPR) repeat protein
MKRVACLALCGALTASAVEPADQLQFADGLLSRGLIDLAVREYRAVADNPESPDAAVASYRIGEARRRQGRFDDAREAYAETIARFPDSPHAIRARFRIAEFDAQAGRHPEAEAGFREIVDRADLPDDLRAASLYYLGFAQRRNGRAQDAEATFRRLLKSDPDAPHADLARVELATLRIAAGGRSEEVRDWLVRAAEQDRLPRAASEALLTLADFHARRGEFTDAADVYARFFARFPESPEAASARLPAAWAYLKAGRPGDALAVGEEADESPEWLYVRANAARLAGRTNEARAAYERLVDLHRDAREAAPAAYELALLLFQTGDFSNAYVRATAAPLEPAYADDLRWIRAESARETGRAEEALAGYDDLARSATNRERAVAARYQAARLKQAAQEWADAAARYRSLAREAPEHRVAPDALFAAAFCETQRGAHAAAIDDWTMLLNAHPQYASADQALFGKAQAERALERFDDAARTLQDFLTQYPLSSLAPEAHVLYGSLLEQREQFEAADFQYQQALRKRPAPALARRAHFRRLAVLQRLGRSEEAARAVDTLVEQGAAAELPAQLLDWAARWNLEQTNYAAALAAARALAERPPTPGWAQVAWHLVGRAHLALKQDDEAGAAFRRAAQADAATPEGLESAWRWGEWALTRQAWDEAETAFDQAAARAAAPEQAEIRARSYLGLGRVAEGRERWADAARQYMAVAVLYEHPDVTPEALRSAARMFERAGQPEAAAQARAELRERYPEVVP